jgi:hypothetical protein
MLILHMAKFSTLFQKLVAIREPLLAVRWIIGIAFLAIIFLTPNLWLSQRKIPLIPLTGLIGPFSSPWDVLFLLVAILSIVTSLLRPSGSVAVLIVTQIVLWALQDQNRMMPWLFQFFLMYLVLARYWWGSCSSEHAGQARNILQLIVVCLYFWSGILKFNIAFRATIIPSMAEPFRALELPFDIVIPLTGLIAPFFEAGCALALLFNWSRRRAVIGLLLMHLFIIASLGPLGLNFNSSVWPWNLMMMALLPALFWRNAEVWRDIVLPRRDAMKAAVIVVAGMLPLLRTCNMWDTYLSFGMYVGNISNAVVSVQESAVDTLPPSLRRYAEPEPSNTEVYRIDMSRWVLSELNSPPNPEPRVFRALARWWCSLKLPPSSMSIEITSWDSLFAAEPTLETIQCAEKRAASWK